MCAHRWLNGSVVVPRLAAAAAIAVAAGVLPGCEQGGYAQATPPKPPKSPEPSHQAPAEPREPAAAPRVADDDMRALIRGNSRFAFDLYRQLATEAGGDGNLFFSPHSISTAFAMTHAGARGNTEKEMSAIFHYDLPQATLHPAFAAQSRHLHEANGENIQVNVANRLWSREGEFFLPEYLGLVKTNYGGELELLDYSNAAAAAKTINDWVARETKGKITKLISEATIQADPALVLTNAIYFKGKWAKEFEKSMTSEQDFHLADGSMVKAPLMHNDELHCGYYEDETLQAVSLPYKGERLSMMILLPREGKGIEAAEAALNADAGGLPRWIEGMRGRTVDVWLPRFTFRTEYELVETLKRIGLQAPFGGAADFSGMNGSGGLFIGAAIHKAFVAVDEEGTEAAAATGIAMPTSVAAEPTVFRADRPFVLMIVDRAPQPEKGAGGSVLFVGRVMNPKAE